MGNWKDKSETMMRAIEQKDRMDRLFAAETKETAANSVIYGGRDRIPQPSGTGTAPEFVVYQSDSVAALFDITENGKTAMLNFASYKNPGGGFINGSRAQEEALCHSSNLYNILINLQGYYDWNSDNLNKALYLDRAIYSPGVVFEKPGDTSHIIRCDVITCAAPNFGPGRRYKTVSKKENYEAMHGRVQFLKDIAEEQGVSILIAGAWGCGVFKQEPGEVAEIFKKVFARTSVEKIIFPIPDSRNLEAFRNVLTKINRAASCLL